MKIIAFHERAPGALPQIMQHQPAHRARREAFHDLSVLVAAGPLGDPPEGAMGIFTTREGAEEFIQGDPFVVHGLVSSWRLVEWKAAFL
jgi:uncharacterized protein